MVAIMQPYFMPYLGYFQLMASVDTFVIYDDVNYINRGWINRNNVLVNGQKTLITVPLKEASQNKKINEIQVLEDRKWRKKICRTIEMNYKKAPHFEKVYEIFEKTVNNSENNLSTFLKDSIVRISQYLDLKVKIIETSSGLDNDLLKKGERLMDICHQLNDKIYVNPIGGAEIYTKEEFEEGGIELKFLEMTPRAYPQNKVDQFVPFLSILDVMMMNTPEYIKEELLRDFKIH